MGKRRGEGDGGIAGHTKKLHPSGGEILKRFESMGRFYERVYGAFGGGSYTKVLEISKHKGKQSQKIKKQTPREVLAAPF